MNAIFNEQSLIERHFVPGGRPTRGWPAAPHDPRERAAIDSVGEWLVCQFPAGDQRLEYFADRGFLHLQLWHPIAEISVLTPSRLTEDCFEMYPYARGRLRDPRPAAISAVLRLHCLDFPTCCAIRQLVNLHLAPLAAALQPPRRRRIPPAAPNDPETP